jgi:hypothetical protein
MSSDLSSNSHAGQVVSPKEGGTLPGTGNHAHQAERCRRPIGNSTPKPCDSHRCHYGPLSFVLMADVLEVRMKSDVTFTALNAKAAQWISNRFGGLTTVSSKG